MESLGLELYKKMYQIRQAEELIIRHYPEDEMKTPMHMSMGQEAVAVAVCDALGDEGQVFGFYRSHAVFLAKTGDAQRFFGELFGRTSGTAHGKAGSMHLAAPDKGFMCASAVVGSSIPLAIGAAFANKRKRSDAIACAHFGDGALEEGEFWESLNAACVMQLPVLFLCEDNGLAVHSRKNVRQGFKSITDVVRTFECNVFHENTENVEVLRALAAEAMDAIRAEERPAFLHIECRRYLDHIGIVPEFEINFPSETEYQRRWETDCIAQQRKRLLNRGLSEADLVRVERHIDETLEAAVQHASAAPLPSPEELYRGVFYEGA